MKAIMSIKPKYAEAIFNGTKKFEFRRNIFRKNVTKVVVYATKPIGKFIGEFTINEIISDNPKELWDKTKEYGGIDEEDFFKYFKDKDVGYAIKIGELSKYKEPIEPTKFINNFKAPQSFMYIFRTIKEYEYDCNKDLSL